MGIVSTKSVLLFYDSFKDLAGECAGSVPY